MENKEVDRITSDSRKVAPNTVFVAIRGDKADGHMFIDKAVQNGAIAVVCEVMPEKPGDRFPGTGFLQVSQSRAALADLATEFYEYPARRLDMIGVTGTNGKTTSTFLVKHLLSRLGKSTGLIGTIQIEIGNTRLKTNQTTPDAVDLNQYLRRMVDSGCGACVMEVSSHALDQNRVRSIDFDVAVFTNLTRDHLDYHGSFEHYRRSKKLLFDRLGAEAVALYNVDDPAGPGMVEDTAARRVSYGIRSAADIQVEVVQNELSGLQLRIDGSLRRFRLVGLFNAYNLAVAYGVGRALGYGKEEVLDALSDAPPVPGRFEQMVFANGTTVIVDYAHTPDALENVLKTIQETRSPSSDIWCVFGCGGNRDQSKRRIMGSIAEQYADRVIVTSDNPRSEDPEAIMNDIRRGMSRPLEAEWIVNRAEAIQWVADHVRAGDVILVAGKGHETYQIIGSQTIPFDDREEVTKRFSRHNADQAHF